MGYPPTLHTTWSVDVVIDLLGQSRRPGGRATGIAFRLGYLADLIAHHGFPAPLPYPGAQPGTPVARSRWLAASVERWFHDRDPDGAAAGEAAARREGEEIMDARAQRLGLRLVDGARA